MNEHFDVIPTGRPLGAEVRGLDLSGPLPDATVGRLREAWLEHLVLLFRDQQLSDAQHFAFTRRFGPLEHDPETLLRRGRGQDSAGPDPQITVISNVVEDGRPIGRLGNREALWHTDSNFVQAPPAASVLRALELPPSGGNTVFMDMYGALACLPGDLRAAVEGRRCKHDPGFDSSGRRRPEDVALEHPRDGPGPVHPLVRTHPETGRQCLYLGRRAGAWITDLEPSESDVLLDAIWACITSAELTWEHTWRAGDLIMWDNRCTMHRRDAFDASARRVLHRTQLAGDRPH